MAGAAHGEPRSADFVAGAVLCAFRCSLSHPPTLSHFHSHSHSLTLPLSPALTLTLPLSHPHSLPLTLTLTHTRTLPLPSHSLSLTLALTHTHSLTHIHSHPRLGDCGVRGWLVSHFLSFVSHFFSFVSHFFSIVSQFFSFVSQAGCLWSGSRPACLPLPFICLPLLFICLSGWVLVLVVGFPAGFSHFLAFVSHFFPKQFTVRGSQFFLKMCPPFLSLLVSSHFHWPCSISIHLSPRSVTAGVRPFSADHAAFLFICLSGLSLLVSRPFPQAMQHFYSFVYQVCHCCVRPFLRPCISLPALSLLVSALFRWRCNISIHWCCRPFPLAM